MILVWIGTRPTEETRNRLEWHRSPQKRNYKDQFRFDAADSCSDFNGHFSKFPGMKAVCRTNNGPIKKKWFCNLKCDNNYPNVWSTRPIKVSRPGRCDLTSSNPVSSNRL